MFEYADIKELAATSGIRTIDLIALSSGNDPFYAGVPFRREAAEWFADIWQKFGQQDAHIRRIHYIIISQSEPILLPNGLPYENTENDWKTLAKGSLAARYLGLIPDGVLVDRRNPQPIINADNVPQWISPSIYCEGASIESELPNEFPVPELMLSGFNRGQSNIVELWAEKSTMNDVLIPLSERLGFNLITGVGEMSETSTRLAVDRAVEAGKPMRILYVSDFDPAGRSMPVAVARKIEHRIIDGGIEADITLQPVILTPEQCIEYRLPRTPIKESEKRAAKFEDRFGSGATELDALEALYPGKLAEIITAEVERYIDPTLQNRITTAISEVFLKIRRVEGAVGDQHADEIDRMTERYDDLLAKVTEIENDAAMLWAEMERDLVENSPEVSKAMIPQPRDPNPAEEPLYDSGRDYLAQIDHYKEWQGK